MTTEAKTAAYNTLKAEAAKRDDCHPADDFFSVEVEPSVFVIVWSPTECDDEPYNLTAYDADGCGFPWVHDSIAEYVTERAQTNNWT